MHYKKSEPHKASVTGDTVGDPFKDTSGPSMNILIKLMSIVSLVIAPYIAISGTPNVSETAPEKKATTTTTDSFRYIVKTVDAQGNIKIDTLENASDTTKVNY